MTLRVQVGGFEGLDELLAGLPAAFQVKAVQRALKKAAQPMVAAARAKAPRGTDPSKRGSKKQRRSGESEKIGHAADSIAARASRSDVQGRVDVRIAPDAAHWYVKFAEAEFGKGRQRPQPFMRPAFIETADEVVALFGQELGEAVEATAKRLATQGAKGKLSESAKKALRS